jgi:signal transduction histidine kinase
MSAGRKFGKFLSFWRRQPDLSRAVVGPLALALILLLAVNAATISMTRLTVSHNEKVSRSEEIRLVGKDLMIQLVNAETGQRGFMLTANPAYLEVYHQAIEDLPATMARMERLIADDPVKQAHFRLIEDRYDDRLAMMSEAIDFYRQARIGEAVSLVRSGEGKAHMDAMMSELLIIDAIEARRLDAGVHQSEQAARWTMMGHMIAGVLILVLAAISIWMIGRYVADLQRARLDVDRANSNLENQVRHRTAELVRANEEVQRFAYIVSHDLRAPLVNIMGYTSELEQVGRAVEEQLEKLEAEHPELVDREVALAVREDVPEAVGFIRASTSKMDRLIKAILKMSREGRRPLTHDTLHMQSLIQTMADAVHHQAEQAGGSIRVEDLPDIISDRLVIEQIFGNLLDNAVKYFDPSRPLEVVIEGEDLGTEYVAYRVRDNGRGVSERDFERIFELFRRAGAQDQPGEGVGLAFVRNSIRRLGGSIEIESEVGKGSTFNLKLPKILDARSS